MYKRSKELADDSWMSSPAMQAAILGGLGYLGTQFFYDKVANNPLQEQYLKSIADPRQRWAEAQRLRAEQKKRRDNWSMGIGGTLAALPLINSYNDIKSGYQSGKKLWGGDTAVDRTISGTAGALSSAIGGPETTDYLSTAAGNKANIVNEGRPTLSQFNKRSEEKSYICDNLNKTAGGYDPADAFAGKDFKMPYVRPLWTHAQNDIPVASSIEAVTSPNNAAIMGHDVSNNIADSLHQASGGLGAGMISTKDLTKTLTRGAFGYLGGKILGDVLGTIFAQPPAVKETLKRYGAIGGAVLNSGIFR